MVKTINVPIAFQYFISLFTIKDKSVRLLVRKRAGTHLSTRAYTKWGLGLPAPLSLLCYKNFITCAKEIVFAYFLLVNLKILKQEGILQRPTIPFIHCKIFSL